MDLYPEETQSPLDLMHTKKSNPLAFPHPSSPLAMDLDPVETQSSPDNMHTKTVIGMVPHPRELPEDIEREPKRPRVQEKVLTTMPPMVLREEPHWMKPEWINFLQSERGAMERERSRIFGEPMKEKVERKLLEERKAIRYVILEYKDPPVILTIDEFWRHISQLVQQEQAKLKEACPSYIPPVEHPLSDKSTVRLDKNAPACISAKELHEEKINANGFKSVAEEAFLAFRIYVAKNDLVEGFDYEFGEILHHCFGVERDEKIYCHCNFTIKKKKKYEDSWTSETYFAEAKMVPDAKHYFCSPIETADDGECWQCTKRNAVKLKHPSGGGYEKGPSGSSGTSSLEEEEEEEEEEDEEDEDEDDSGDDGIMHLFY